MSMNKDQVEGRVKEVKGKIKEVAGNLVGNETMEAKGKIQKTLGQAQAKFGDVKKDLKDARRAADSQAVNRREKMCSLTGRNRLAGSCSLRASQTGAGTRITARNAGSRSSWVALPASTNQVPDSVRVAQPSVQREEGDSDGVEQSAGRDPGEAGSGRAPAAAGPRPPRPSSPVTT